MTASILVTGGAGYIGSHVVAALLAQSQKVIVLDNLTTGFQEAVYAPAKLIKGNVQDIHLVKNLINEEKIDTIIHLAASTVISQSIEHPEAYYENNTVGTLNLLRSCIGTSVKYFVYSSTSAVYSPIQKRISEKDPTQPLSPYGHSKLMSEQILKDIAAQTALKYVILRYFNVAGACPMGNIGQRTPHATHLIKVAVQTACGLHSFLPIYGNHYPTPDGTCIRDFVHVSDVAMAHCQSLSYLQEGGSSVTLNCGYGNGFSVKEVIQAIETITGQPLPTSIQSSREGDLPSVIADNSKIKQILKWQPQFNDLSYIVKTALDWEKHLLS